MTDLAELKRLAEAATSGPWEKRSYQSGTVCVVMREWIGPKTKEYGHGFLAAHMTAYNIDFQDEHLIDAEKNATASFIAAANPAAILSLIERVEKAESLLKIERGVREAAQQNFTSAFANGHAAGRAEALEEAAKVAGEHATGGCACEGYGCNCGNYDDAGSAGGAAMAKHIATAIRSKDHG